MSRAFRPAARAIKINMNGSKTAWMKGKVGIQQNRKESFSVKDGAQLTNPVKAHHKKPKKVAACRFRGTPAFDSLPPHSQDIVAQKEINLAFYEDYPNGGATKQPQGEKDVIVEHERGGHCGTKQFDSAVKDCLKHYTKAPKGKMKEIKEQLVRQYTFYTKVDDHYYKVTESKALKYMQNKIDYKTSMNVSEMVQTAMQHKDEATEMLVCFHSQNQR
jgi:hypothetical protein